MRIYAIHGAAEARVAVYEHLEVLVHPIRLRLTAALAAALQDYFQLRDEDSRLMAAAGGGEAGGVGIGGAVKRRGGLVFIIEKRARLFE